MQLCDVQSQIDAWLEPHRFKDYGPNGLQVQGRTEVQHVVTGVTASLALIEAAVAAKADVLLVHHGLFWRGYEGRITGWLHARIKALMQADLNLLAYHLPLDAHPHWGNNAQLARVLGLAPLYSDDAGLPGGWGRFGEQNLGFVGTNPVASRSQLADFAQHIHHCLGRAPVVVGGAEGKPIHRVGWCTGGAQSYFEAALAAGVDAFITGEISEPQAHLARETGVAFLACGHHATERYGVQALGEQLAATLGVRHTFIDIDNPA